METVRQLHLLLDILENVRREFIASGWHCSVDCLCSKLYLHIFRNKSTKAVTFLKTFYVKLYILEGYHPNHSICTFISEIIYYEFIQFYLYKFKKWYSIYNLVLIYLIVIWKSDACTPELPELFDCKNYSMCVDFISFLFNKSNEKK